MDVSDAFSGSYAQARARFLAAAAGRGLAVDSRLHPLRGIEGEELAMDVVLDGPPDAAGLLILTSACHGVEGYCGSGVQVAALHDAAWREHARQRGIAVLYIHALNPHGFSHGRRVTNENVDLNRNFHDFSRPLPVNAGYREIADLLLPDAWPPDEANQKAIESFVARRGLPAYQAALSGGQHEYPDGLFYGGVEPTWSNLTLRAVLRRYAGACRRLGWIDFHTGLGPNGLGERIYAGPDRPADVARARAWWAGGGRTPVTSIYDGSSTSAFLTGMMWQCVDQEVPQAEYTGLALEYGTVPILEVTQALRGMHWLYKHPECPAPLAAQIRQRMREAFYTDTDGWKSQVLAQAREAMLQAVDGLAA